MGDRVVPIAITCRFEMPQRLGEEGTIGRFKFAGNQEQGDSPVPRFDALVIHFRGHLHPLRMALDQLITTGIGILHQFLDRRIVLAGGVGPLTKRCILRREQRSDDGLIRMPIEMLAEMGHRARGVLAIEAIRRPAQRMVIFGWPRQADATGPRNQKQGHPSHGFRIDLRSPG